MEPQAITSVITKNMIEMHNAEVKQLEEEFALKQSQIKQKQDRIMDVRDHPDARRAIKIALNAENKAYNQSKYIKPNHGYNHSHPIYTKTVTA